MKRTVFTLIGLSVLMVFPFVSCEDKLTDDKKNSGEESEGEGSYKTVQDSVFYYSNGKLQRASYSYFDSKGNQTGSLNLRYDAEGNMTFKEERTMTSSDEDGNNTVVFVNNNGLSENQKVENTYSGSGRNYTRSIKRYIYHNGEWLLMSDDNEQSDNYKRVISRVQYALYNDEEIVVSRQKSISKYSDLTDNIIESDRTFIAHLILLFLTINSLSRQFVEKVGLRLLRKMMHMAESWNTSYLSPKTALFGMRQGVMNINMILKD